MGVQSSGVDQTQTELPPVDIEKLQSYREQITDKIILALRQHLLDNMGELGYVRSVPAAGRQFVDLLFARAARQIDEQEWVAQLSDLARRGLGTKTAVALIDILHDELQARLGVAAVPFARRYRQDFLNTYMEARQGIVVADHENIHKSLTITLEKRLTQEQTLRAALEQEQALALKRAVALATVAQINLEIAAAADEKALLQTAVTLTNQHFQLYHTHIYLLDDEEEQLILAASAGEAAAQLLSQRHAIPLSREESLAVRAVQTRRALVIHDTRAGTGFLPNPLMSETRSAVAAPLLARERLLGILNVQSRQPNYFTEDDVNIQAALAVQVATALGNARSLEETKSLTTSLERQLEEINTLQRAMTHQGWQAFMTAKERPVQGYKFARDDLLPLSRQELAAEEWPLVAPSPQAGRGGAAVLPITTRDVAVGALAVRSPSGQPLNNEQRQLLADISNSVAEALERARLFEEAEISREQAERALTAAQRRTEELAIINEIVTKLGSSLDMQRSMQIVADGLAEALGVEQVRITLVDEGKENLTILAEHYNPDKTESALGMKIPLAGNELTQEVMRRRKAVQITDVEHDARVGPVRDMLLPQGIEQIFVLPMLSGNEVIGTVGIDILDKNQTLTDDQMQLAETIVSQAATAVQSSRLFTQVEERAAELATINAISEAASSQLELDALIETVGLRLYETFNSENLYIALYDEKTDAIDFPFFYIRKDGLSELPSATLDEGGGFTAKIIKGGQPILFAADSLEKAAAQGAKIIESADEFRSITYAGVPMMVGNKVIGVIGMNDRMENRVFTEADQDLLLTLAGTVGVAIQNARLFVETEERAKELAVINQVAEVVAQQLETDQLFTAVHEQIKRALAVDTFFAAVYDSTEDWFEFVYFFDHGRQTQVDPLPADPSYETVQVYQSGKPITINYTKEEYEAQKGMADKLLDAGKMPTNMIFVPLRSGTKIIGVVSIQNYQFYWYTEADVALFGGIANHVAVALENIRLFTETQKRAERERLVNEINQKIQSTTSVESALQVAVQELGKAFGAKHTAVQLSLAPKKDPKNGSNGSADAKRSVSNGS